MAPTRNITQQIRFLFTAVTLFCVLLLNNQEITTYGPTKSKSGSEAKSHLKNSNPQERTVVKQKVSFEATTSYFVLQLIYFTYLAVPEFSDQLNEIPEQLHQPRYYSYFFSVLFNFIIIPNAP